MKKGPLHRCQEDIEAGGDFPQGHPVRLERRHAIEARPVEDLTDLAPAEAELPVNRIYCTRSREASP